MINQNVPDPNIIFDFNARVQSNLNLELVCGLDRNWEIASAKITHADPQAQRKPIHSVHHTIGPTNQNGPIKKMWRPVTSSNSFNRMTNDIGSSSKGPFLDGSQDRSRSLETNTLTIPEDRLLSTPKAESFEADSDSNSWAMQLRDGRRIFVPTLTPISLSESFLCSLIKPLGGGADNRSEPMEEWDAESLEDNKIQALLEEAKREDELWADGEWDEEAMWVEPIAISLPPVDENKGTELVVGI